MNEDYFAQELQEQSNSEYGDIDWDDESQGADVSIESYDP